MAAPITHIVISEKLRKQSLIKYDSCWDKFITGTSFPDIRYISSVDRSITHLPIASFNDVVAKKNCFIAGMLFHNYVDIKREDYIVRAGLYDYINDSPLKYSSLKFYEDIILNSKLSAPKEIAKYYTEKNYPKNTFGVDVGSINKWNQMIQEYITSSNLVDTIERFISYIVPKEQASIYIAQVRKDIKVMEKHKEYKLAIENMYEKSEGIFS